MISRRTDHYCRSLHLGQLEAFVGYCRGRPGMVSALQRKDFAAMAAAYNGEDYGTYDRRFARA